tara:strand:+ start:378 stop:650 length:273 start_codon:yes stop_codon:yes gene_type:complete
MKTILVIILQASFVQHKFRLIENSKNLSGLDNLNPFYDPILKESRLKNINAVLGAAPSQLTFYKSSFDNKNELKHIFKGHSPKTVISLAA